MKNYHIFKVKSGVVHATALTNSLWETRRSNITEQSQMIMNTCMGKIDQVDKILEGGLAGTMSANIKGPTSWFQK